MEQCGWQLHHGSGSALHRQAVQRAAALLELKQGSSTADGCIVIVCTGSIFCRMLVGVGDASFVALAALFIGERLYSSAGIRLVAG